MGTVKSTSVNKRQFFQDASKSYTFEYSRYWEVKVIEGIPTLFDPLSGNGAMQFFYVPLLSENRERYNEVFPFLKKQKLQDKMKAFYDNQNIPFSLEKSVQFSSSKFVMIGYEHFVGSIFYFVTMLQKEDHFLLVLFNREKIPEESEISEITQVIRTIQFLEGSK